MFGIQNDPKEVTTLLSHTRTEVWIKQKNNWEKLFG
jgi:hypothetical protein